MIFRKSAAMFREKRVIAQKVVQMRTIGVTKMRGNFVEILFPVRLP